MTHFQITLERYRRGLHPLVAEWLFKSQHPLARENREQIKMAYAAEAYAAAKEQLIMTRSMYEEAKYLDPKASVRPFARIHPWYAGRYMAEYGRSCLHDPDFIRDCRKTARQLFFPKP